jgi:hypothetical protein
MSDKNFDYTPTMKSITPEVVKANLIDSLKNLEPDFDSSNPKNEEMIDLFVKRKMSFMWDIINYMEEDDHDNLYDIVDGNYE